MWNARSKILSDQIRDGMCGNGFRGREDKTFSQRISVSSYTVVCGPSVLLEAVEVSNVDRF